MLADVDGYDFRSGWVVVSNGWWGVLGTAISEADDFETSIYTNSMIHPSRRRQPSASCSPVEYDKRWKIGRLGTTNLGHQFRQKHSYQFLGFAEWVGGGGGWGGLVTELGMVVVSSGSSDAMVLNKGNCRWVKMWWQWQRSKEVVVGMEVRSV